MNSNTRIQAEPQLVARYTWRCDTCQTTYRTNRIEGNRCPEGCEEDR